MLGVADVGHRWGEVAVFHCCTTVRLGGSFHAGARRIVRQIGVFDGRPYTSPPVTFEGDLARRVT
jgi:hypothetical protein